MPSELKHLIAKLSSPNTLAALARTHTAYQREAEKALYDTLCIDAFSNKSLKCMETLATNSEKAALVRFLTIEYASDNTSKNRKVTTYLSKSLINMHSLSDFRIKSFVCGVEAHLLMRLGKILWSVCIKSWSSQNKKKTNDFCWRYSQGHFRLQTFYSQNVLNITGIIKSQTELQVLGLYIRHRSDCPRKILKTLKGLHNAQLSLPIVLILDIGYSTPFQISIFPAFYSVNRRVTIPQVLAQSFSKDLHKGDGICIGANITDLSMYLIDSSDMPAIFALAKGMAVAFPRIGRLNLWFERRCEIVSFLLTCRWPKTAYDLKGIRTNIIIF